MKEVRIKIKKLPHFDEALGTPTYQTAYSAGADIKASLPEKKDLVIGPGERVLVPTGLSFEIPEGHEVQVRPRSGLSLKTPLMVLNSPGTIDADYRGEVKIILGNLGKEDQVIKHGDRIAQLVVAAVYNGTFVEVDELTNSTRGEGGFGSTGHR